MPDNATPATPQAGGAGDTSPQAGTTTPSEPQAGDEPISLDEAKKLRSEAANLRKRLKAFEDQQAAAEAAKLTEQEKLQKQLADTQSQLSEKERLIQERVIRYEVQLQAAELGANPRHLDKIARLIDSAEVKLDDQGVPTNVKELVDKLLKEMPELLLQQDKRPPSAGGATNPSRAVSSAVGLSWDVITKMTPEQYNARRAEIQAWIADNPARRH